jgi:hypothetical protein
LATPYQKISPLQGSVDCPTLEFEYGDADAHAAELSGRKYSGSVVLGRLAQGEREGALDLP